MDFEFLMKVPLFKGFTIEELQEISRCLELYTKKYEKDQTVYHTCDVVTKLGIVISGSVMIENIDMWGNRSIIGLSESGQLFAESYACLPNEPLMVDVVARENTEILFVDVPKIFTPKKECCPVHANLVQRLLSNLLVITSRKNLKLSRRIFFTSSKTIRERLLNYFSDLIASTGKKEFYIPLDRQQMADFLNVERTALCKELGKMKKEGLLDYHKNFFKIKD